MTENYTQLQNRIAELESKVEHLTQLLTLPERVTRIETSLLLVADVYKFKRLQELLVKHDFREADKETIQVILEITGAEDLASITPNEVRNFPCNQLQAIDKLWTTYSQGKFGFSVQVQLYQQVGGSLQTTITQDNSVIERLGELVGWRVNNKWQKCDELDYTFSAPSGCHPSRWWNSPFGSKMTNFFLNRLMTCNI
jgi:GUN4-like